jgi:hypothetical protein
MWERELTILAYGTMVRCIAAAEETVIDAKSLI